MAFTQQTFLGASIRYFKGSLGWGENPSTLNVGIVEDPTNGDAFIVPGVGVPVLFQYDNWTFGGIIQNWTKDFSTAGHPVFDVTLVDPREILNGVQLILSGYSSTTYGVPNLINVFGHYENQNGFGSADVNEAGIPWRIVKDTVTEIAAFPDIETYGGPISLGGYKYSINLLGLPNLPSYFRVPAQSMSLMEFIKFVCDAANYDFFFSLTPNALGGVINLVTINRNLPPVLGAIDNFISSVGGSVTKNAGYEFNNGVTSKFLIGGPVSEMYVQEPNGGDDDDYNTEPEQNSIWPFWGLDYEQNTIIGQYNGTYHQFNLPTKSINVFGVGDYYPTDNAELMAAFEGMDSWLAFLSLNNNNRYVNEDFAYHVDDSVDYEIDYLVNPENGGLLTNNDGDNIPYHHNNKNNPHFGKATTLKDKGLLNFNFAVQVMGATAEEIKALPAEAFSPFDPKNVSTLATVALPNVPENGKQNVEALFNFIQTYARSYFGQKFMVRLPFIESAQSTETNNITLSREPVSSGFIDEDDWETAVNNNLLPANVDRMLDQDFKIKAYVRFNNIDGLDFSNIDDSNLILSDNGQSAFVLCDVSPEIVYQDFSTLYSPRAVVSLPGPVFPMRGRDQSTARGVIAQFMLGELTKPERNGGPLTTTEAQEAVSKILGGIAATNLNFGIAGLYVLPDIFIVPLKSNISRYGPWYATGANGRLELEIAEGMVPWTFGGYDEMNQAANAQVTSAINNYQVQEAGSIQFDGVPSVTLGGALVSSGPYVTDINVSIDAGGGGATTTYNMGTWTPQFGQIRKSQSEYISRINKRNQELRQQFRSYVRQRNSNAELVRPRGNANIKAALKSAAAKKSSPHIAIVGSITEYEGNVQYSVVSDTDYGFASSVGGHGKVGGASLDTIFVPFSLDTSTSGIPHFEIPTEDAETPTVLGLNPFSQSNEFGAIVYGNTIAKRVGGAYEPYNNKNLSGNGIALRMPLILAGWGYNTSGDLVPNVDENGDSLTLTQVRNRPDLWKCGPLDCRYDEQRKVWVASAVDSSIPNYSGVIEGYAHRVVTDISCTSSGLNIIYGWIFSLSSGVQYLEVFNY